MNCNQIWVWLSSSIWPYFDNILIIVTRIPIQNNNSDWEKDEEYRFIYA